MAKVAPCRAISSATSAATPELAPLISTTLFSKLPAPRHQLSESRWEKSL